MPPIPVCYDFCFTNEVQESPVAKTKLLDPKGHYELHPQNSNQGKDSKFDNKSLTPSMQEGKNTYLPRLVHPSSRGNENTYKILMHRKRACLRSNYDINPADTRWR